MAQIYPILLDKSAQQFGKTKDSKIKMSNTDKETIGSSVIALEKK